MQPKVLSETMLVYKKIIIRRSGDKGEVQLHIESNNTPKSFLYILFSFLSITFDANTPIPAQHLRRSGNYPRCQKEYNLGYSDKQNTEK